MGGAPPQKEVRPPWQDEAHEASTSCIVTLKYHYIYIYIIQFKYYYFTLGKFI